MYGTIRNLRAKIPAACQRKLRQRFHRITRPAWLGTIRRTSPLSDHYGYDRGTPVDRYYIERFLEEYRRDIHGHVLEVKDSGYTDRYGADIDKVDVLDIDSSNPRATIIGDLSAAGSIPADHFECFILTQTLQLIYDFRAAVIHAQRCLRPGGVLLATVPSVCRVIPREGLHTDYWRFTLASCSALFGDVFGVKNITVRSHGNVLTATAFLMGMAYEELSAYELNADDEYFPLIITVRAIKR